MAVNVNLLERRSLTAAVDKTATKAPKMFLENAFFPSVESHLTRTIDFETIDATDRLAVYVNPTEQSRLVEMGGTEVKQVTLATTKEHNFHTTEDLALMKGFGGSVYGGTTADIQAYRNAVIARGIAVNVDRIRRRREWAAAQALTKGQIEYAGDSLHFLLKFGFTSDQLVKLSGAAKWDGATPNILTTARKYRRDISKRSGSGASICVLGTESAELFLNDETVLKRLDNQNYRIGALDLTKDTAEGATMLGTIGGITYYEYAQTYTDAEGNTQEMFPVNMALFGTRSPHLRRHRGIIAWEEEGLQSGKEFYSRQLVKKDPDGRKIEVASCELPIIHDPGALIAVTTH